MLKCLLFLLSVPTALLALDCERLCGEAEEGKEVTGDCCSTSYCVCSAPQAAELTCDEGLECDGETFHCCQVETTPTPATSTTPGQIQTESTSTPLPLDCQALCLNIQPGDNAGDCCAASYCLCSPEGGQQVSCQPGHSFCPAFSSCMDMYGNTCQDTLFDCCVM